MELYFSSIEIKFNFFRYNTHEMISASNTAIYRHMMHSKRIAIPSICIRNTIAFGFFFHSINIHIESTSCGCTHTYRSCHHKLLSIKMSHIKIFFQYERILFASIWSNMMFSNIKNRRKNTIYSRQVKNESKYLFLKKKKIPLTLRVIVL